MGHIQGKGSHSYLKIVAAAIKKKKKKKKKTKNMIFKENFLCLGTNLSFSG